MRDSFSTWLRGLRNDIRAMIILIACLMVGLMLWGLTVYVWRELYTWFEWVSEPTFLLTFLAIPLPYLIFLSLNHTLAEQETLLAIQAELTRRQKESEGSKPLEPNDKKAAEEKQREERELLKVVNHYLKQRTDWLTWLGNGDANNGTLVLLIFLFWSILYWNWPGIDFDSITVSVWGLVTIFGLYLIRATLFRPGKEVPASDTSKS